MTYFAGVRAVTPTIPTGPWERRLVDHAASTGRAQVRRDDIGQWFVAIPHGGLYFISPANALADPYIREAIGWHPGMSFDEIARRIGSWHAQHAAFCSTVRSDQNGIGVMRRETA